MISATQNHRYDLFTHIEHTVSGIKETASALLRVAAFFQDIGKSSVAMENRVDYILWSCLKISVQIR